ncbi:CGNR zinc finger domain-containing protein [Hyphococcus sp.]|jgi:predicted RNA-binding Zn ribbon-like protein|uniref:CGNR zinc finger domain-containing protein n=1 Tax=Hyphococcus sp. TaxID=2038636 RepID=UPI003D1106C3
MRFSPYAWSEKDMIGGNAALDFVNTAAYWTSGDPQDRLGGPEGFGRWAEVAGLLYEDDMARLKEEIAADPKAGEDAFETAVALRAALWRIFNAVITETEVDDRDLALLDDCKVRAASYCRLARDGDGFRRRCADEAPALERALRLIVEAAEDLLLNGRLDRLHACGGENCDWIFVDTSKNGRRRWCDMATCGNDAKVKKFRGRKKKAA